MILNKYLLLNAAPIRDMLDHKVQAVPTSYGLTECGYDIRLKQEVKFRKVDFRDGSSVRYTMIDGFRENGHFVLGSSIEMFEMPNHLMGRVLNKSTWARLGLDASLTTNIEPGWKGHLTIELVYNGHEELTIPAGAGICQVIFETIAVPTEYVGKYQNQEDRPVQASLKASEKAPAVECPHGLYMKDMNNNATICAKCGKVMTR